MEVDLRILELVHVEDRRVARPRRNGDVLIEISLCDSEGRCAGGRKARDDVHVNDENLAGALGKELTV